MRVLSTLVFHEQEKVCVCGRGGCMKKEDEEFGTKRQIMIGGDGETNNKLGDVGVEEEEKDNGGVGERERRGE